MGACPINLQRSSISFSRMDIDDKLALSILKKHIQELRIAVAKRKTTDSITEVIEILKSRPDISYHGYCYPLAATKRGYTISTRQNLRSLKTRTIYIVKISTHIESQTFEKLLNKDEVILFYSDTSMQITLSIFRATFTNNFGHLYDTGIPESPSLSSCCIVQKETSKEISKKGKVAASILKPITKLENNTHTLFKKEKSADKDSKKLIERTEFLYKALGENIDIFAFNTPQSQKQIEDCLITELWNNN